MYRKARARPSLHSYHNLKKQQFIHIQRKNTIFYTLINKLARKK